VLSMRNIVAARRAAEYRRATRPRVAVS